MDGQAREVHAAEEETITDIQNYLASFNKEIQNGTPSSGGATVFHQMPEGTHLVAALNEQSGVEPSADGATTYYVTHSADGSSLQGYHYDPNGQVNHGHNEELIQVVQSHGATMATQVSEQPNFVAMQPRSSAGHHLEGAQQVIVSDRSQGLAALMSQDEAAHVHNVVSQQNTTEQQTIRMVVRQPDGTETEQTLPVSSSGSGGSTLVTSDGQEIHVSDEGTLQMMANLADQTSAGGGGDGNNQVLLNTGNSYQTVTIVPSDTNPGEVSYVLIVSQPDENKDDQKGLNMDMSVYDFNEVGEKYGEVVKEEASPDGSKMRTIRISPKKSQTVTQAHMCNYCNYTSPKRYLLSRHMKSHSEERPHKCSVCECGFKTLASLQNHVNTHTGTRPHHCKECDSCFTTSGELVRHVRYRHTHEKPHRCTECDYASVELSKLKRHMRCHTGERPYQCPHCTYASPDTYKLKRHLRIHTGEKPYECEVCHARFTQSNSLKAHRMIHSGNKPMYQCEFCPTTCGRKTDLRIHVQKLHTSDKPLKCKRCGKSFPDRYSLKIHVKTHEGEKCFKCDLCSYASISQRHLESHMLIHTDQKPFHCDECDQSFRQKQLLKRHKNLYHDPNYIPPVPREKTHECAECGKAFRHKGNLIRHLAIHDPDATEAEKAEAMLIGQQNELSEDYDGEESYSESEESLMKPVPIDVEGTIQEGQQEGQQVVVFEVIQLPGGVDGTSDNSEQTLTELQHGSLSIPNNQRNSQENVTILQHVQNQEAQGNELMNNDGASLAQVPRESATVTELIEEQAHSIMTLPPPAPTPRRRGRPRKYPLPAESQPTQSPFAATATPEPVQARGDGQENKKNQEVAVTRRRKTEEYVEQTEAKRGRIQYEEADKEQVEPKVPLVPTNPEEVARREEEMMRKRQEQKQRDMAECFGFDDNEDEETILAMPAAPGTKGLQPVCL
ncbi:zinc finger protein 37-like isoform X2 [Limulus polyphemus]|nr:zinc finger protein 37-like isoform X2 [Limulus polyphemus]XP_013787699.1 zinc finger protein 37-like isoform X2 [Limulus polyphemus]